MNANHVGNALALEAVKGKDHFLLVYPNTPTGRLEAKEAVRTWLLDCELTSTTRTPSGSGRQSMHAGLAERSIVVLREAYPGTRGEGDEKQGRPVRESLVEGGE